MMNVFSKTSVNSDINLSNFLDLKGNNKSGIILPSESNVTNMVPSSSLFPFNMAMKQL